MGETCGKAHGSRGVYCTSPLSEMLLWIHTGWEDTLQKWCNWLEEMKKMIIMRREALDSCTRSLSLQHGEEVHRS